MVGLSAKLRRQTAANDVFACDRLVSGVSAVQGHSPPMDLCHS
jgi:hypothetical protein